jgi:stage II sporulation protein D
VRVATLTASGRVAALDFQTERGRVLLTGSEARVALRSARGEMLNSTHFSVGFSASDGALTAVTLRGYGNGHGVGMCQWGAIGRARAGHDAAAILAAYYPGTRFARVS